MNADAPSIVIGDQHPLCRAGLATMLADRLPGHQIVVASDFAHLVAAARRTCRPVLLAVDFGLPGLDGMTGLNRLKSDFPKLLLVVMSDRCDRHVALECLGAGAHGYVPKNASADEVMHAFDSILSGHIYVPIIVSDVGPAALQPQAGDRRRDAVLTERQQEVLHLISAGRSNKEIARALGIAEGTVKVHIAAGFRALGVHNRVSAADALRKLQRVGNSRRPFLPGLFEPATTALRNSVSVMRPREKSLAG